MKRLGILVLVLFALLFNGCGYSQEELQNAQDESYNQGWEDGYAQGLLDTQGNETPPPYYVGSINSNIYHHSWCIWAEKILPQNEIWFDSPEDARAHGYRPCEVCNPP